MLHCAQMCSLARQWLALILLGGQYVYAAQPAPSPPKVDAAFEADIRNFCDVLGLRKTLIEHREQAIETSRLALLQREPGLSREFLDEWTRRMRTQLTPNAFIDALVPIVARYFSDDEVNRLIAYRTAVTRHQPATLPPDLQKKMAEVMPSFQASFAAEASRIAVKLGSDLASQIRAEPTNSQ